MITVPPVMILFGFISYYSSFFIDLCLLGLKHYNICRFTIPHDKELVKPIMKRLENECTYTDTALTKGFKKKMSGWFWNKNIIGNIYYDTYGEVKIVCLTTDSYFKHLIEPEEESFTACKLFDETIIPKTITTSSEKIYVFSRYGAYKDFCYSRLMFNVTSLVPILGQESIVSDVITMFNKKKQCNLFVEGPPCSGKSSLGYLIAKQINGVFCNTFNPSEPGDTLSNTISRIQDWDRDENVPIVILIDEVDIMLKKIHANEIKLNSHIPTLIYDKPTWSKFMDNMRFYKNIVLIFTSNTSKTEIDKLDTSYLRPGRIDICSVLDSPVYKEDGTFLG